jgi:YD repeat-containing protein
VRRARRSGTSAYATTPDGDRVGFTFAPEQVSGRGFTYFLPRWVPDAGGTWQLTSAPMQLQRAAGSFYALDDGAPYNPAALTDERAQYTLTDAGGVRYELSVTDGVTAITYADGVRLTVSDSGIVGPGNAAIVFTQDASGRLARVTDSDGRSWQYTYDADGNLQAARDLSAGSSERYAYADPASHRLTLVSAPSGGQSIAYGNTTTVVNVTADLGPALSYLNHDVAGVLPAGGTDLYTFAVRDSEVALPQGGAFLLGVRVTAGPGLVPALPQIDGTTAIVQRSTTNETYAVFRIDTAGLETLRVTGAGSGAYTLRLFAAGDTNDDGQVDARDFALLEAAAGSVAGDGRYDARADIDADGRVNATDTQLVYANLGFTPNLPALIAQVEFSLKDPTAFRLSRFPVDQLYLDQLLPMQEDLHLLNGLIDIRADFRVIGLQRDLGRVTFGVPSVIDENGNRVPSPNRPLGVEGLPQGLSAHATEVAPGPLVYKQFDLGRDSLSRHDLNVADAFAELMRPPNCPDPDFNSTVQLDTGAVIETHDLVSYQSMGQVQQLHLKYDSLSADPRPIITFGWQGMHSELSAYASQPDAELTSSGDVLMSVQITFTGDGGTLEGPTQYYAIPTSADDFSVGLQSDLSSLPSGYYNYTIHAHFAGKDRPSSGTLLLDNEIQSAFGRGWGLQGVQDLYVDPDGSVDLVDGDGNAQHFGRLEMPGIGDA